MKTRVAGTGRRMGTSGNLDERCEQVQGTRSTNVVIMGGITETSGQASSRGRTSISSRSSEIPSSAKREVLGRRLIASILIVTTRPQVLAVIAMLVVIVIIMTRGTVVITAGIMCLAVVLSTVPGRWKVVVAVIVVGPSGRRVAEPVVGESPIRRIISGVQVVCARMLFALIPFIVAATVVHLLRCGRGDSFCARRIQTTARGAVILRIVDLMGPT